MAHRQPYGEIEYRQNPFENFQSRNEFIHLAEDQGRLCPSQQIFSLEVIKSFINHDEDPLDKGVPCQFQTLHDYLTKATTKGVATGRFVGSDVTDFSSRNDIALLDDRHRHPRGAELSGNACTQCEVFSAKISISKLYERLTESVRYWSPFFIASANV